MNLMDVVIAMRQSIITGDHFIHTYRMSAILGRHSERFHVTQAMDTSSQRPDLDGNSSLPLPRWPKEAPDANVHMCKYFNIDKEHCTTLCLYDNIAARQKRYLSLDDWRQESRAR